MAAFTDHVRVVIDVVADQARKGIKNFRTDVAQAEGTIGKLKAGASSAFGSLGINATTALAAAGGAFAAFAKSAVNSFVETATAARELGAATGLATEDASRWIAVADDFGIGADAIAAGVGKITKTLDASKWEKYGIATRDAAGNARDANDIFLDVLDMLGEVENQSERARIGAELLGKGYGNLAPLVGKTREEYEGMLDAVSDAQAVTDQEAQKALDASMAFDDLQDSLHDAKVELGEKFTPAAIQGAESLVFLIQTANDLVDLLDKIPGLGKLAGTSLKDIFTPPAEVRGLWNGITTAQQEAIDAYHDSTDAAADFDRQMLDGLTTFSEVHNKVLTVTGDLTAANIVAVEWSRTNHDDLAPSLDETGDAADESSGLFGALVDIVKQGTEAMSAAEEKANALADAFQQRVNVAIDEFHQKFSDARDDLAEADLVSSIADQIDRIAEAQVTLNEAREKGADEATTAEREYQGEVRRLRGLILDLIETYGDIPANKATEIIARVQSGSLEELDRILDEILADRFVNVGFVLPTTGDAFSAVSGRIGAGTTPTLTPTGVTGSTTIIYPTGSTPTSVVVDGRLYDRRNGPR